MRNSTRTYTFTNRADARNFIDTLFDGDLTFKVEPTSKNDIKVKVTTFLEVHQCLRETYEYITV